MDAQNILFHKTTYDSAYIIKEASVYSIRAYSVSKYNHFNLRDNSENKVAFVPDYKIAIGLGFSYKNLALDLGIPVFHTTKDTIHTKNLDFIGAFYPNQNLFDIIAQSYKGLFLNPDGSKGTNSFPRQFRKDIKTLNLGIDYSYLFNYKRYSFIAPYIGTEIQRKSAGSLLAGGFVSYYHLTADSSIIPVGISGDLNESLQINKASLFSFGLTAGYAYTLVLPKRFFITLSATPGISFNTGEVTTVNNSKSNKPFTASFKLVSHDAIGYGGKKFYGLATVFIDNNYVSIANKNRLDYFPGKVKFILGYRFN